MHAGNFQMTLMWPRLEWLKISFPFECPTCLNLSDHQQSFWFWVRDGESEWGTTGAQSGPRCVYTERHANVWCGRWPMRSYVVRTEARTRRHASNISEHETSWGTWREKERQTGQKSEKNKPITAFQNRKVCNTRDMKRIPPRRTESASFQLNRETSDTTGHKGALQRRRLRTRTNHSPAVCWQLTATANICTVTSAHIQEKAKPSCRWESLEVRVSFCLFDIQKEKMKKRFVISLFAHHYHYDSTLDFMLGSELWN